MTLRLGGDGAITGCTSLENPDLTVSGLTISGSFDAEKVLVASGTAAAPSYTFSGDTDNGLYYAGTNSIGLSTAGTNAILIDSSGNVGIGETSPSYKLHVKTGQVMFQETAAASNAVLRLKGSNTSTGGAIIAQSSANGSAPLEFYSGTTQTMRIDSSGRVGIGTTSPGQALDVKGIIQTTGTNGWTTNGDTAWVYFGDSNNRVGGVRGGTIAFYSDYAPLELGAGGGVGSSSGSQLITFKTGTNERARIDSSGRLLVGTTTYSSTRPSGAIHLDSILTTPGFGNISLGFNGTAVGNQNVFTFYRTRGTSAGSVDIVQSGDSLGSINFNGADGVDALSAAASIKAEVDGTPGANDMPGRLMFATTADGASSPTERMRIDSSGVIDFTGPGYTPSNNSCFIKQDSSGEGYLYNRGNNDLLFGTNNTERMRIDNSGNVGIGDNDPDTKLSIKKPIDAATYGSGTRMIDFKSYFPGYDETGIKASIYSGVSDIASLNTNKGYLAFLINNGSSGTSLDERLRILPTGGITFNGDTAQANALDDYEEGTWTPVLQFGGASVGQTFYNAPNGIYTKIGNQVTVRVAFRINNLGSSTGSMEIAGLPYTGNTGSYSHHSGGLVCLLPASVNLDKPFQSFVTNTSIQFRFGLNNNVPTNTDIVSGTSIFGTITYTV